MEEKLKNIFYLDPEYMNFIPRKSRLKYSTVGAGWVIELLTAGMVVFWGFVVYLFLSNAYTGVRTSWQFNIEGLKTTATIISCQMLRHGRESSRPEITYTYTVADVVYTAQDIVQSHYPGCSNFSEGTQITIQYYPPNPIHSRIAISFSVHTWVAIIFGSLATICFIPFTLLTMIFSGWLLVFELKARQRFYLLRREGVLLDGEVVQAEYEKGQGKRGVYYFLKVTAKFETPDGRLLTRIFEGTVEYFVNREIPQSGTPVKLLYVNDKMVIML
jgi:hypothetical protein